MFFRFVRNHACVGETDRQQNFDSQNRDSMLRGAKKNLQKANFLRITQ